MSEPAVAAASTHSRRSSVASTRDDRDIASAMKFVAQARQTKEVFSLGSPVLDPDTPRDGKNPRVVPAATVKKKRVDPSDTSVVLPLRERVWVFLDDPSSSRAAQFSAIVIMLLILVSSVVFVMDSTPGVPEQSKATLAVLEAICVIVFTVEVTVRILVTPRLCAFFKGPLNLIDILSIVPFYVELFVDSATGTKSTVLRVVRLIRVFRVFKISRYLSWMRIFTGALASSAQPLAMLGFIVAIATVMFSSAMFYVERGRFDEDSGFYIRPDGSISPFYSIPSSFYWCIITMTTVGYGDTVPVTAAGKVVAMVASISGVLVLAIPITVISANFTTEYNKVMKQRQRQKAKVQLSRTTAGMSREAQLSAEVDEMVARHLDQLRGDLDTIIDHMQIEIKEELKRVITIARAQERLTAAGGGAAEGNVDRTALEVQAISDQVAEELLDTPVVRIDGEHDGDDEAAEEGVMADGSISFSGASAGGDTKVRAFNSNSPAHAR